MKLHPPSLADYYMVLGVSPQASAAEIKQAFRTLVKQYHPDLYALDPQTAWEAEILMKEINEAYAVLSDSAERQRYDRLRQEALVSFCQATPGPEEHESETMPDDRPGLLDLLFLAFPGRQMLSFLQHRLSAQPGGRGSHKQMMGALSKATLLPLPFCTAMVVSALFWHLAQGTGHPILAGLTAVLAYPLILIPMLLRFLLPIRYQPLLSAGQKLVWTPVTLMVAMLLSWFWVVVVDHSGTSPNPFDLYWWCALISTVCICLAYF